MNKVLQMIDGVMTRVPIKLWLDDIEEGALSQARNLANLPFVFRHVAIMPDSHQGYGMPIGAIIGTKDVIIPNAVGVDIGCGMCAVKTSLTDLTQEDLKTIIGGSKEFQGGIRSYVPVGREHHSKKQDESLMPDLENTGGYYPVIDTQYQSALKQIGTLGGGNHFIEIQKGSDGHIWVMVHSGSRNIGYTVAKHYNKIAIELNKKYFSSVHKNWELAFLPLDSQEGQDYIKEMNYCVDFAKANRALMMENIKKCFIDLIWEIDFDEPIDISHNYARMENHFNTNVMIHRKGATSAYEGEYGIIPGSQGSPSYIVKGKGNPESFKSCSHGAGRLMSRKAASNNLDLAAEQKILDDQNILHSVRGVYNLDEATGAYKDIKKVMINQFDLVNIEVKLNPLAVIKG